MSRSERVNVEKEPFKAESGGRDIDSFVAEAQCVGRFEVFALRLVLHLVRHGSYEIWE